MMETLFDVIHVEPHKDNTLYLLFENQDKRSFDMTPYLNKKPFLTLKNSPLFMQATVQYGTVVWPNKIDISPETLWDHSIKVDA